MARKEYKEQVTVAKWLDYNGVDWFHVPNERNTSQKRGRQMKMAGVKSGVPDIVIPEPPPALPSDVCGAVIEVKRRDASPSDVTENQADWLDKFAKYGRVTAVCLGADQAINQLEQWGYPGHGK